MGGSIGLRLKQLNAPPEIVGFGRTEATLKKALERNAIDRYELNPADAVCGADFVLLCAPVKSIPQQMSDIADNLLSNAIVTDVGSTKSWIVAEAEKRLPKRCRFAGSHPMTGSERDGIDSADATLYEQSVVVITPSALSDEKTILTIKDFWRMLGAIPIVLPPQLHDKIVASVSHLPHVLAALLVEVAAKRSSSTPRIWELAAGGFRDTTRISSSNPLLWRDICLTNKNALLEAIDLALNELAEFKNALMKDDSKAIENFFYRAKEARAKIPAKGTGLLPSLFDLSVEAPDKPGIIADITGSLATAGINIIDIEVARLREAPDSAPIRLFFESEQSRTSAISILKSAGYSVVGIA